jgi:hypothetical protein
VITIEQQKRKRGRPRKNQTHSSPIVEANENQLYELAALTDFITQYGSGSSLYDIKLSDLYSYLRNPYKNIKNIRKASKYLTNKHGILKDVLKTMRSLPTLNFHLAWSSYDNPKQIQKYEKKVLDFIESINVKKMVRDGLYEVGEVGTIVTCLRNNKYVQFLDLDDLRINRQRNGKWVVEFDLQSIKANAVNTQDVLAIIESLPDEVTIQKYNDYRKKGESVRYVELSNCHVITIDGNRNFPFGLPLSLGAWASLIQKEIINRVERSVSDRLIKQILILYAGNIGGDKNGKPAPKPLIEGYFKQVSDLILKKDQALNDASNSEISGTGVIALPDFFKLEGLKVDVSMFTKDLYNKIDNEIFMNLGISPALVYGGGDTNFSVAQVNSEKFFRYIFTLLEAFEDVINDYIKQLLPSNLSCKFFFEKTTILDRDKYIDKCKEFYLQTGVFIPWAESLFQVPYHYIVGMKQYQDKILKLDEIINPPLNAHTTSGDQLKGAGRPETDAPTANTDKSKTNGGNSLPSPSD